jgi:Uncharacterized low-complexity proteins
VFIQEHLEALKRGKDYWNEWRASNAEVCPDLSDADLSGFDLSEMNLRRCNLDRIILRKANLYKTEMRFCSLNGADLSDIHLLHGDLADSELIGSILTKASIWDTNMHHSNLSGANLQEASLIRSNLNKVNFENADLSNSDLSWTTMVRANCCRANLSKANLAYSNLTETNFDKANLTGSFIYGISAWGLSLDKAIQNDLIITNHELSYEPVITVDNLEVAQFIHLLLKNERVRQVINTLTTKVVLILGRFLPERKKILDAIKEELRYRDYLPVIFDFERPDNRGLTETVSTLAHLARFIIVDITEPRSMPQELQRIVPDLPSVPVQPILQSSADEYEMFEDFRKYPWVLEVQSYNDVHDLVTSLQNKVIIPVEAKIKSKKKML